MGCPERRVMEQLAIGQGATSGRVDTRHRQGLVGGERREQPHETLGQHRLARPGRPDQKEVVTACRGDFDRAAPQRLSPHVRQVGRVGSLDGAIRGRDGGPALLAPENGHQLAQRGRTAHVGATDQSGLTDIAQRHHQAQEGCRIGQGDHARDVPERAIQPELAAEGEALGAVTAQLARGDEEAHRDGEVETGATFAHARGCQIHHGLPERPRQATGQDRGTDAVA